MQVELLGRRRWGTRLELATAISGCFDRFHNTRRLHSALGMLTPTEHEHRHRNPGDPVTPVHPTSQWALGRGRTHHDSTQPDDQTPVTRLY